MCNYCFSKALMLEVEKLQAVTHDRMTHVFMPVVCTGVLTHVICYHCVMPFSIWLHFSRKNLFLHPGNFILLGIYKPPERTLFVRVRTVLST